MTTSTDYKLEILLEVVTARHTACKDLAEALHAEGCSRDSHGLFLRARAYEVMIGLLTTALSATSAESLLESLTIAALEQNVRLTAKEEDDEVAH